MHIRAAATVAIAAACLIMPLRRLAGQLRPPAGSARRASGTLALTPRASVTVGEPVYILTGVVATISLTNVRNVKSHVRILNTTVDECRVETEPAIARDVTPVGGRGTFVVELYFLDLGGRGRTCELNVGLATPDDPFFRPVRGATVQIAQGQTYTIEHTWDLKPWISEITATRINAHDAPCSGMSAGLSGVIPIGAAEYDHDLSFTLRSGIHQPECTFDSAQPYRRLKRGWAIIDRRWKTIRARGDGDACSLSNYSVSEPSGGHFYVHSQMRCGGGPDNDNGIRLVLEQLTLTGPPNGSPLDAFISGSFQ